MSLKLYTDHDLFIRERKSPKSRKSIINIEPLNIKKMNQPKPTKEQKKEALRKIVQYVMKQRKEAEDLQANKKEDSSNNVE